MKQETNNEMDLLLRRLSRRPDISVTDGNGDVDHLDADELSAYAENVLPAAARARYTAHLAECARCRELVVQLSSSAPVVRVGEVVKAPELSGLRKFLASFFSPMVLRYAVPALGLIVVAAIGVFVLRQKQREGERIAQNTETEKPAGITSSEVPLTQPQAKPYVDQPQKQEAATAKPAPSNSDVERNATAAPSATPTPEVPADAARGASTGQQQPVTTTEAQPAPKPADETQVSKPASPQAQSANGPPAERAKAVDTAKVNVEDRREAEIAAARSTPTTKAAPAFSVAPEAGIRARDDDAVSKDKKEAGKDKNDSGGETKKVAGRHFRKRDGVWVDTAYDSSRGTTNVTRGSEQYRALIADEPALKTIADQLDGEIIVVWKNRTYRIQ